jgi:signal transduction histidine kinase
MERREDEQFEARRMRALDRLSRALAHDVNGPLNAMALHLDLLRRSLAEPAAAAELGERRTRYAETMRSEMQGLERALRRLLTALRPAPAERATVDLGRALRELGELVEPHARSQRTALVLDLPETELRVEARPDRLRQALLEILLDVLERGPRAIRLEAAAAGDRAVVRLIAEGGAEPGASGGACTAAQDGLRELGGELVAATGGRTVELRLPLAPGRG